MLIAVAIIGQRLRTTMSTHSVAVMQEKQIILNKIVSTLSGRRSPCFCMGLRRTLEMEPNSRGTTWTILICCRRLKIVLLLNNIDVGRTEAKRNQGDFSSRHSCFQGERGRHECVANVSNER